MVTYKVIVDQLVKCLNLICNAFSLNSTQFNPLKVISREIHRAKQIVLIFTVFSLNFQCFVQFTNLAMEIA